MDNDDGLLPKTRTNYGGWSEIRTHGGRKSSTVFKTVAFNRSAIHPHLIIQIFAGDASVNMKSSQNRGHKGPERSVWGAKTTRAGVFSSPCV